jgi:hypothetical protein
MPFDKNITPTSGTPIVPGGIRQLTIGEIALAKTLYGYSIRYHLVWVHRESYLPFNLQPVDVAMSPNGEMWFREETYSPDFSLEKDLKKKYIFIHEMMHVWQTQKGMFVRTRGLFSGIADYTYNFDQVDLLHYGLEQQASIVSDYWLVKYFGLENNEHLLKYRDLFLKETVYFLLQKYENLLKGFPG